MDADSGYLGAEKKDDAILVNNEGNPIRYQINKRPSQLKKASGEKFELLKAIALANLYLVRNRMKVA